METLHPQLVTPSGTFTLFHDPVYAAHTTPPYLALGLDMSPVDAVAVGECHSCISSKSGI